MTGAIEIYLARFRESRNLPVALSLDERTNDDFDNSQFATFRTCGNLHSWIPATGFFPFTRPYAIRYVDGLAIGFLRGCMLPATPLW
jgi:hypothetical protein